MERSIDFVEKYKIRVKQEHAVTAILRLIHEPTEKEAVTIGNIANVDGFANQKAIIKYIANWMKLHIKKIHRLKYTGRRACSRDRTSMKS